MERAEKKKSIEEPMKTKNMGGWMLGEIGGFKEKLEDLRRKSKDREEV